jgi:hypothetical protein
MSRYDIMHEHVDQRETWPPLPGVFKECKTHRYVAIIEVFNNSLERIPRDYKEITLFLQWRGQARTAREERYLPAEKYPYLLLCFYDTYINCFIYISNKPSFRQEHPGVSDSPDSCDGTSYPLTENQTRQVVLYTSLAAAIIPCLIFLWCVALYIMLTAPASGFLYFTSGMWRHIRTIRTTRMLHSSQGSTYIVAVYPTPSAVYAFHRPSATF